MVMMPLRLTAAFVLALSVQQAQPNTALVVGRVLDQTDGRPISSAVVELLVETPLGERAFPGGLPRRQMTDSLGRFVFRELPGGSYQVRVTYGGTGFSPSGFIQSGFGFPIGTYLDGGYGQRRPGGPLQSMLLADGQAVPDLVIQLWRGAVISGIVSDDTGEPVVDTVVGAAQLSSDGRLINGPTVRTDDRGMYRLSALAPGRYVVFVPQTTTAMSAESADELMRRVSAVRAGQSPGTPAAPVPELTGARFGSSIIRTDSTGLINGNVPPRRTGDAVFVFQTTFYPATANLASASAVELAPGDERSGIDVLMQPVRGVAVSGTLVAAGGPAASVRLRMVPAGTSPDATLFETAIAQSDASGRFTFPLVPVGNYRLMTVNEPPPARPGGAQALPSVAVPAGVGAWLNEAVGVGPEGIKDLAVTLKSGFSVRGQMSFIGSSRPTDAELQRFGITLRSVSPRARADALNGGPQAMAGGTAAFAAIGLSPGRYVLRVASGTGSPWRLQSVMVGGRDVNDMPFDVADDIDNIDVVFTDRPASVSGRVTSAEPGDGAAAVLLFPSERSLWPDARAMSRRFRLARTTGSGDFRILDVPPGDYLAIACLDTETASWPDVSFLIKLFADATPVHVTAGQQPGVSLTVKKVR